MHICLLYYLLNSWWIFDVLKYSVSAIWNEKHEHARGKWYLINARTGKTKISLRSCADWSESSLFVSTIYGISGIHTVTEKTLFSLYSCPVWSVSALCTFYKPHFPRHDSSIHLNLIIGCLTKKNENTQSLCCLYMYVFLYPLNLDISWIICTLKS